MKQPFLIDQIIVSINFELRMTNSQTTTASKPLFHRAARKLLLHRDTGGEFMHTYWNYISIIDVMNCIQQSTWSDVPFAVLQCVRFCDDSKGSHMNKL